MKLAFVAIAMMVAAPVAAAQSGAEAFHGKWACMTATEKVTTTQTVEYLANGRFNVTNGRTGALVAPGMLLQVWLTSEGTWSVAPDGKLVEQPTRITVTDAKMAGGFGGPQPADKRAIQQSMNASMDKQRTVSTFTFSDGAFQSTGEDGAVANCKRQTDQ